LDASPSVAAWEETGAVQLFLQRAQANSPDLRLTDENAATVVEICRRLDGLPLAIELAAARLAVLSLAELERRLEQQLSLLTGGARDQPARQQTMRGTIAWSVDLLNEPEQRLYRQLAVFAGGWTLEAVAAIADTERDVLDGLSTLVASSLVQRHEQPAGTSRYSMLEPIRQFAREQLGSAGEATVVRSRHAIFFSHLATRAAPLLGTREAAAWLDQLEREHANLWAALGWYAETGNAAAGIDLVGQLRGFWFARGFFTEGVAQATTILGLGGAHAPTPARARALATRAWLALWQGDYPRTIADCLEALAICAMSGDRTVEPYVRNTLGLAYDGTANPDAAREQYIEALGLAREMNDLQTLSRALVNLVNLTPDGAHRPVHHNAG
jgi:predicted ATPase